MKKIDEFVKKMDSDPIFRKNVGSLLFCGCMIGGSLLLYYSGYSYGFTLGKLLGKQEMNKSMIDALNKYRVPMPLQMAEDIQAGRLKGLFGFPRIHGVYRG